MVCPVCGNECELNICPVCGFDASADAERYPTIAFVSARKTSKSAVIKASFAEMLSRSRELESRVASLERDMNAVLQKLRSIDSCVAAPEPDVHISSGEEKATNIGAKELDLPGAGSKLNTGDLVLFGRYPQSISSGSSSEIEWYVLDANDEYALLISGQVLDFRIFYDCELSSIQGGGDIWKNSALRKWLNGEFYENAFDAKERGRILTADTTRANTIPLPIPCDDFSGNADNVFLLSIDDYGKYSKLLPSECKLTPYASKLAGVTANKPAWWQFWLRSAGENICTAICVDGTGSAVTVGHLSKYLRGVRPAIFIEL